MIRFLYTVTIGGIQYGKGEFFEPDDPKLAADLIAEGNAIEVSLGVGEQGPAGPTGATGPTGPMGAMGNDTVHPYYFFHGYAGDQLPGDSVFFDKAAGNNGIRGADLSDSEMFANAGYVTTKAPSNPYDIAIRIPNLNYDYANGESLFLYWRGIVATPASEIAIMGDGTATTTGNHGIQIRSTVAGKFYIAVYGADGGKVGQQSTNVTFDGTAHDFAIFLDGQNKAYAMWTDGEMDLLFSGGYLPFNTGFILDTKNANTFNLGAAAKAPGVATLPQGGAVTKTRNLVILRFPSTYTIPSLSKGTSVCKSLRTSPAKLLLEASI